MIKQKVVLIAVIATGLVAASGLVTTTSAGSNFKKYGSIEKLAKAIDNGNFDDDDVSVGSLKSWSGYKHADGEIKDCIDNKADLGNNLGDYEILKCVNKYN